MKKHALSLLLIPALLAALFPAALTAEQPEALRARAAALFDGNGAAPAVEIPRPPEKASAAAEFLLETKQVLSAGAWDGSTPGMRHFLFRHPDGWTAQAQSVGLEGFLWTKKELEGRFGADTFLHHVPDYFSYLDALLSPVAWTAELRSALGELRASALTAAEKNARLDELLDHYVAGLQDNVRRYDAALWAKKARVYQMFPRAYNLAGRREAGLKDRADAGGGRFFGNFRPSDFEAIKAMGFDAVWPMGILPIGVRGQTGTGGGSPYSISDHSTVNPDLGAEEEFRRFVRDAHAAGLRVIVDFVVNHTSLDSKLLLEDPAYFIGHRRPSGPCPNQHFEQLHGGERWCVHHGGFEYGGGVSDWIDTAQIDYSSLRLRARMTGIVKGWVTKFDVDGFRVDMAHLDLNNVFGRTWGRSMPRDEFYRGLIAAVKEAKPSAAFMAEAYSFQEDLSACGFDAIYSKFETGREEGQTGWYQAMEHGSPQELASSVNRLAFLAWQSGGAGAVAFTGNHDEPAPERVYGERLPAALALTFLYPGSVLMYNGAEIGYDASVPTEHKPLPFSVPCAIDWQGGKPEVRRIYSEVLALASSVRAELGDYGIEPLWAPAGQNWTGYAMKSASGTRRKAVIGNITRGDTWFSFSGLSGTLRPGEYRVFDLP
ncbi:MAG TPA: alpha-amylase family glycosyl hydrolase [Elusimicrobiales bacterium]|nr:alpha-amylase family glycosyl hydrolase [Elusimicrobiales bacterium]